MKRFLVILCLAASTSTWADTLVAPPEFANTESPAETTFFAFRNTRVQQVFNGNYFGPLLEKGGYITELRFRVDGGGSGFAFSGVFDMEIQMSSSPAYAGQLNPEFSANHGSDLTTVLPRTLVPVSSGHVSGGPNSFSVVVPLPNRFLYSPFNGGTCKTLFWLDFGVFGSVSFVV